MSCIYNIIEKKKKSDNKTNFVGTDNELRKALKEMIQKQIQKQIQKETISYEMEQIGLHGTKTHLVLHIWVESGSTRLEVLEVSLLLC